MSPMAHAMGCHSDRHPAPRGAQLLRVPQRVAGDTFQSLQKVAAGRPREHLSNCLMRRRLLECRFRQLLQLGSLQDGTQVLCHSWSPWYRSTSWASSSPPKMMICYTRVSRVLKEKSGAALEKGFKSNTRPSNNYWSLCFVGEISVCVHECGKHACVFVSKWMCVRH